MGDWRFEIAHRDSLSSPFGDVHHVAFKDDAWPEICYYTGSQVISKLQLQSLKESPVNVSSEAFS